VIVKFTMPGIPPSVNHYKKPNFKTGRTYLTNEATHFYHDLAVLASGQRIRAKAYRVEIEVFLGFKERGDVDNFAKVVLDGLVHAGVIHSDAAVEQLYMTKQRDKGNPRTVISVQEIEK
jgi:Holliday junction resolvase RusA-like endonuclease